VLETVQRGLRNSLIFLSMTTHVILVDVPDEVVGELAVEAYISDEIEAGNFYDTGVRCNISEDSMLYVSASVDDAIDGSTKYRKVMEYSLIVRDQDGRLLIDDHDHVEETYDSPGE